jgi:hypothetical protein
MSRRFWNVLIVVSLPIFGSGAFGQLVDVSNSPGFSADSVAFTFNEYLPEAEAGRVLGAWGIRMSGQSGSVPRFKLYVIAGSINVVVENSASEDTSANKALVLDFDQPAKTVSFRVPASPEDSELTVEAYSPLGVRLGEIRKEVLSRELVAVSTSNLAGIGKLVISWGSNPDPEEIDDLQVEFLERQPHVVYLAQIGNGAIPGVGALQTTVVVTNLSNSTAQGELAFFAGDSSPLELQFGSESGSAFSLEIPPAASVSFTTGGPDLKVGYARVTSRVPVEATAIFRVVGPTGNVLTEAGVGSARSALLQVGAVQKERSQDFDSGIAVVNVGDERANAVLELLDPAGQVIATNDEIVDLNSGAHTAAFLSQIFPSVANQNFEGSIRIRSNQPMAAVILRAKQGLVYSSLPVGSTEK